MCVCGIRGEPFRFDEYEHRGKEEWWSGRVGLGADWDPSHCHDVVLSVLW